MSCDCPIGGVCSEFGFTGRRADICAGRVLTPEACDAYRKQWAVAKRKSAGDVRYSDTPCIYRGEVLRQVACDLCGQRGALKDVYACEKMGECTERKTGTYPIVASCFGCEAKAVRPQTDS